VSLGEMSSADKSPMLSDYEDFHDDDAADDNSFERVVSVVVPTLFGLIALTGLVGNLVVVLVVSLYRRARTATSLLMANLAVADLVFIIVCVPTTAARYALPVWPLGVVWCKVSFHVTRVRFCLPSAVPPFGILSIITQYLLTYLLT